MSQAMLLRIIDLERRLAEMEAQLDYLTKKKLSVKGFPQGRFWVVDGLGVKQHEDHMSQVACEQFLEELIAEDQTVIRGRAEGMA